MPKNDIIFQRLQQATETERQVICDILDIKKKFVNDIEKISKDFRSISGHTVANKFRDAHGLEYKTILIDTFNGLYIQTAKDLNDDFFEKKYSTEYREKATIQELENDINCLVGIIYENLKKKHPNTAQEEFVEKIKSAGRFTSRMEGLVGGGGLGLFARLISLPVAAVVTTAQALSTPTYSKTYIVVVQLIQIKNRIDAEQKLKDL